MLRAKRVAPSDPMKRHARCIDGVLSGSAIRRWPVRKEPAVQDISTLTSPEGKQRQSIPARAGAIGKGIIAYLLTGSLGVAVVVFIVAKLMGC
jgi:hypothetical protein